MKLHVDLDTLQFIEGPGFRNPVDQVRFKRGDAAVLEVVFLLAGTTPTAIGEPADLAIEFGLKPEGGFGGDYLVHETAWTKPAVGSANPVYSCTPNFSTAELDTAMGIGGTELPELAAMAEISWTLAGAAPTSTRTVDATVENDVNRGTEGTPLELPTPDEWLAARAMHKWAVTELRITVLGTLEMDLFCYPPDYDELENYGISIPDHDPHYPWWIGSLYATGDLYAIYRSLDKERWLLESFENTTGRWGMSDDSFPWGNYNVLVEESGDTPLDPSFAYVWFTGSYKRADDANVVHKSGDETVAGAKTFSGQVELTGQAATNGTSAMTKNLIRSERILLDHYDNWNVWTGYGAMVSGGNAGANSYATAGTAQAGNAIGGWARLVVCQITTRPHGAGSNAGLCAVPLAISIFGSNTASGTSVTRYIVGDAVSGTPAWSTANPISARGFGLELYAVAGVPKMRLFTHNGTTFNYGTAANYVGDWLGEVSFVLASTGTGQVMLYHAGSNTHQVLGKPTRQAALTMYSGPYDGVYGSAGAITMVAVGDNVAASSALGVIVRGRIHLNHPLT